MLRTIATHCACTGLLGLALLLPRPVTAAWPTDPAVNVPLCTAAGKQARPKIVSDGAGGAIVAWTDTRVTGTCGIYAQRVLAAGTVQWTADGVPLACCGTFGMDVLYPNVVSDDSGGAIVAWQDARDSGTAFDVYAQQISDDGTSRWPASGSALCTAANYQINTTAVSDGAGGVIVVWQDLRTGGDFSGYDIYAQRISASDVVQWLPGGVALCTAAGSQGMPSIASDGAGGAIIAWTDVRSGGSDIYAQRISADGTVQWTIDGVALCAATGNQAYPTIVSDDAGGAIVTWHDSRSGGSDIYAQRISGNGTILWAADGVGLCTTSDAQVYPKIASDGAGGAIVTWRVYHSGIYAQRISASGTLQWPADGVVLCTAQGDDYSHQIISDDVGGAIVTWEDYRRGLGYYVSDIYAQRVSAGGVAQWTADGVALCTAYGEMNYPAITSDGAGGAIVAWQDARSGDYAISDIYVQRVRADGQLGGDAAGVPGEVSLAFALDPVCPNPTRGGVLTVRFTLPAAAPASLELLDVAGRRVAAREVGSLGEGIHTLDLGEGLRSAPGLYFVCLRQGGNARTARVAVLK